MKTTRESERPARTSLGTTSTISSTRVDRQWRHSCASTGPMPFRRHGGRVPHRGETERHATGVHAGGTPALPGGRLLLPLLLLEGAGAGLPGRSPAHTADPSGLVVLRRLSCLLVDHSLFVCSKQGSQSLNRLSKADLTSVAEVPEEAPRLVSEGAK